MVRLFLALGLLLLGAIAHAQRFGLVLISPDAAGPHADLRSYVHPTWVFWPRNDSSGVNRLRSIASGLDWQGAVEDLSFRPAGNGEWRSPEYPALVHTGYLSSVEEHFGHVPVHAVANPRKDPAVEALFLALRFGSDRVRPLAWAQDGRGLLVYVAQGWDDCAEFVARHRCRTVVVEYPAPDGAQWSRFWLLGPGWHPGLPVDPALAVPGLVPSKRILNLVANPTSFVWESDDPRWAGANRWFDQVRRVDPWGLGFIGLAVIAGSTWAILLVARESRSRGCAAALLAVGSMPAAIVAGGFAGRVLGLSASLPMGLVAWVAIVAPASVVGWRFGARRALFVCASGNLVGLLAFDPRWSAYSGVFGLRFDSVPTIPAGCLLSAILLVGLGRSRWPFRILVLCSLVVSLLGGPWWGRSPEFACALAFVWLAGERWLQPAVVLFPLAVALPQAFLHGLSWLPDRLIATFDERMSFNVADLAHAFVNPLACAALCYGLGLTAFCDRFVLHQLGRVIRFDPRRRTPLEAAAACAVVGLAMPNLLGIALVLAIGGGLLLLYFGVSEL